MDVSNLPAQFREIVEAETKKEIERLQAEELRRQTLRVDVYFYNPANRYIEQCVNLVVSVRTFLMTISVRPQSLIVFWFD
jgi:hypothetical protein